MTSALSTIYPLLVTDHLIIFTMNVSVLGAVKVAVRSGNRLDDER
jgi:hypothetical protein